MRPDAAPAVECVPTPLPCIAGQLSKPEHKEAAAAAGVQVGKGALAALTAERKVLTKAREAFRVQFEKLRAELVVARAAQGKLAISTRRYSLGAEEYENEPVVKKIMQQLHNLNIRKEAKEQRLASSRTRSSTCTILPTSTSTPSLSTTTLRAPPSTHLWYPLLQ